MKSGVHRITPDEYFNGEALRNHMSNSFGKLLINRSPAHALASRERKIDTKAMRIGSAVHLKVLGAGSPFEIIPDDLLSADGGIRTKAAKEWKASREEEGLTVIKRDEAARIDEAAAEVTGYLAEAGIILAPLQSELVAVGEIDGIRVKAMIDNAPADEMVLMDLKTCASAHPDDIQKAIWTYGYDFQAAHYVETWKAATGEDRQFRFVFVEKEPPFGCAIVQLGADSLEMARKRTRRAREIMADCLTSGVWPCYPVGVQRIDLPEWYHNRYLEREAAEAANGPAPKPSAAALAAAYEFQKPLEAAE